MSNKQTTPEQPATDIGIYIAALQATYRPASAPAEATHFFSTAEVVDAIKDIDPSAYVTPRPSLCRPPRRRLRLLQPSQLPRVGIQVDVP